MRKLLATLLIALAATQAHSQAVNGKVTTAAPTYTNGNVSPLSLDTAGNLRTVETGSGTTATQVQGNSASGAADVGNPVKGGAVFNTTPPTVTNGQRVDNQADANGGLRVMLTGQLNTGADAQSNASIMSVANPANNTAAVRMLTIAPMYFNGTTWDRARGDTTGITLGSGGAANNIGITGQTQSSATSGQRGDLTQGAVTTAAPTYTTGNTNPLSLTTGGSLRTDVIAALPTGANTIGNIGTVTTLTGITNALPAGANSIGNIGTVTTLTGITNALPAGTNVIGVVGNSQSTSTGGQSGPLVQGAVTTAAPGYTNGNTHPLSMTTQGNLRTENSPTSGITASSPATATTATVIKASAGILYGVSWPASGNGVVKFYDNASACSGTIRFAIATGGAAGPTAYFPSTPITFTAGITTCNTVGTTAVDTAAFVFQ